jgi:DNA polymerase (family X)
MNTNRQEILPLTNGEVAKRLHEVADLLEMQHANPFRVRSYRAAAQLILRMNTRLSDQISAKGIAGLEELPGIGHSLSRTIEQLTRTGHLSLLQRLRGIDQPERLFQTIGGIGTHLAKDIHEQLGIETLQDLEIAAYDGRLGTIPRMGKKRLQAIRETISGRFRRHPTVEQYTKVKSADMQTSVSELLDIDREYREKAKAGKLPLIAPRRFNPNHEAWLPILHTIRGERHYTALYSNTAHAHELGATGDWLVIYRDDHEGDGQWTVITAHLGPNKGKRIVRGREIECSKYYASYPLNLSNT